MMKLFHRGFETNLFIWIFSAVAGTLLLLFFINLSFQHERTTTLVDERQLVLGLEHELEALRVSEVTSKPLALQQATTLRFDCDSIFTPTYRKKTEHLLFAPPSFQGSQLLLWTHLWSFPFPIDTFYYVTDKRRETFLIYDDSSAAFVQGFSLPSSFSFELIHVRDFDPRSLALSVRGLQHLTLVFFTPYAGASSLFSTFSPTPLSVAVVHPLTAEITLFDGITEETTSYLGEPMLYGLFVAPEHYSCVRDRALERLRALAQLYTEKVALLASKFGDQPQCQSLLFDGQQLLQSLQTASTQELPEIASALQEQHQQLVSYDCPTIY